jgi:cobalt transporter subunit CbtB
MAVETTQTISTTATTGAAAERSTLVQAVFAVMLGLFVVGFTGFSPLAAVHNAAHDTRHSSGFPCH